MTIQYADLLTIGAGGGAYPAAFRLARAGRSVVMVDPKGVMSGNCLYEGCVPSKAVRETAEIYQSQRRFAERGLPGTVTVDFAKIMAHKDSIQARRYQQHAADLAATPNIQMIQGEARFITPHEVAVDTADGERRCGRDAPGRSIGSLRNGVRRTAGGLESPPHQRQERRTATATAAGHRSPPYNGNGNATVAGEVSPHRSRHRSSGGAVDGP